MKRRELLRVTPDLRPQVKAAALDQAPVGAAPVVIVVAAEPARLSDRYGAKADAFTGLEPYSQSELQASQGFESIFNREMSETGRTVPDMNEPLSRYDVTVTVAGDGDSRPDLAAFALAADQAAWRRSASIISAHLANGIISVVTVTAPDRYAAVAVARAVVSDALNRQALSSSHSAKDCAQHRAEPAA